MPSWQSTSRIGCPIDNPARRSRGAAPSTRPQWTRVPLDFRPRWRYVVNKAGAANAAPALKYKFYFTPHFCGYTEFGIVPLPYDEILEWNATHPTPISSNFPNNLIKSDFLILQSLRTAASETQPFAFFAMRRIFFFVFS